MMNMLLQLGSFRACASPEGPRESYAVQIGMAENAQACATSCQVRLQRTIDQQVSSRNLMKSEQSEPSPSPRTTHLVCP